MDNERVQRSINRMAYQIAEENRDESGILLVGVKEQGYVIAQLLCDKLRQLTDRRVEVRPLDVGAEGEPGFKAPDNAFDYVVLVDDVIFSGRTMLLALQKILEKIQPGKVRTAVLVDRGHRVYPVEAAFTGMDLPTKLDEHVQVLAKSNHVKKVVLNNKTC